MQSLNVAQVVTVLAVMMWALLFGVICYPLSLHEWFYELVEWVPFWFAEDSYFHRFATVLDYCTAGTLGMSLVGLALDTYFSIQVQNYHHVYLALACVANGPRHMRFIALLGIALSGRFVWRVVCVCVCCVLCVYVYVVFVCCVLYDNMFGLFVCVLVRVISGALSVVSADGKPMNEFLRFLMRTNNKPRLLGEIVSESGH